MGDRLYVFRDTYTSYERVGFLEAHADGVRFAYDSAYDGPAISHSLPKQDQVFSARATEAFFSALAPEGDTLVSFLRMLRLRQGEFEPLLRRLNDETIGGLLFSVEPSVVPGGGYRPIEDDFFDRFSLQPRSVAVETMAKTRLSLTGAVAKVGLYRNPASGTWFYPEGNAASTHIIKAGSELYPYEVINEALCMDAARRLGFPVAECEVLQARDGQPLLAVTRFDRVIPDSARMVDGNPVPMRLHQEDFCQVLGWLPYQKYEPTDGRYLTHAVSAIRKTCSNAFGESQLLAGYVLYDYLIGNCDNHLKNFALLYNEQYRGLELAPRYDVLSTVLYPNLFTEMGVSLSPSRNIIGVSKDDVIASLKHAGISVELGMDEFRETACDLPGALADAAAALQEQGFNAAKRIADLIIEGVRARAGFVFDDAAARSLLLEED